MKSKQRVLAALEHRCSDRVPIALLHGNWEDPTAAKLRQHFYLRQTETLSAIFRFDTRAVEPFYVGPKFAEDADGNLLGIWGTPEGSMTFTEEMGRPLKEVSSVAEVESYLWPKIEWFDFTSVTYQAALYKDYAIVGPRRWSPIFSMIADLCGFETALVNLLAEPAVTEALIEKITDFRCAILEATLDAAPGQIDIAFTGDDPAGQSGMLFSPDVWRRFFKPAWARLFSTAKSRGVKVMHHICGSPVSIIPDLIDIGMDIMMPLQLGAGDMDPDSLKREYGQDITFWGGVNTQHLMPYGRPDDVRAEVRRLIDILGHEGGFILSSSHDLMDDVPVENIVAMYDEAISYYPFLSDSEENSNEQL